MHVLIINIQSHDTLAAMRISERRENKYPQLLLHTQPHTTMFSILKEMYVLLDKMGIKSAIYYKKKQQKSENTIK